MKKLLRKLIILIILVCIFVLIKKHSTPLAITASTGSAATTQTGTVSTGIDLTNCVSYFDGCNHCSVKDGKADACTLMYCEKPTEPKCLQYATGTETTTTTSTTATEATTGTASLANPASVNCEKKGGTLEIITDANGGQSGMCTLSDGTKCEERAFFRGECGTGDISTK